MIRTFERSGIRFNYPQDWVLETEATETGWTVSLSSPESAFLVISFDQNHDDPDQLADSALAAMREAYPTLDAVQTIDSLAGQPSVGYDLDFFALDLTNTCWIRAQQTVEGAFFILGQFTDGESERAIPILKAILASMHVD